MRYLPSLLIVALVVLLLVLAPVVAQTPVKLMFIGDSNLDEYSAEDLASRDMCPASLPACLVRNSIEQLVMYRGGYVDLGAWGYRNDLRRTGYRYNVARSGMSYANNTNSLAAHNANGIIASETAANNFGAVVVMLGANDFAYYISRSGGGYLEVYYNDISVSAKIAKVQAAASTMLATIRNGEPNTPVFLMEVPLGMVQAAQLAGYTGATGTQRALDAINGVNAALRALAASYANVYTFNYEQLVYSTYTPVDSSGYWHFAGYNVNMRAICDDPRLCGVSGAVYPHLALFPSGRVANMYLDLMRSHGVNVPALTDNEILQTAGLGAAPTNTPLPPTNTPVPPTATNLPPTVTSSPVPPTSTSTPIPMETPTKTPLPTNTPEPPTATPYGSLLCYAVNGVEQCQTVVQASCDSPLARSWFSVNGSKLFCWQ